MTEYYNKHYIKVDPEGRITSGWSDGPIPDRDTSNAVLPCAFRQTRNGCGRA